MTSQIKHSVFIADDDEDDRLLLKLAFAQHSPECNLIFAEDGLTLLEALAQESTAPCLIILDLNMPRLNGFEALQQVRHSLAHASVPVVILTTSNEASDRKRAYALGANEFLTKPLNLISLGQLVSHLRQQWHLELCIYTISG
ncbi:response regulator [Spirosoma pollinicola]|uniref:Response regulator n=1 Tax=Spirosoma pollinicola TaxID=2057025 RepID=A0A2K8Z8G0_9BACT|nr:response regulator [Spirosoma pollinicola]AUD06165.1 response regulator [Spirosoma pollinicola]